MKIEQSIKQTEYIVSLTKEMIPLLEKCGLMDLANENREKIKDLEKSLEHERKVQLAEAQKSGRKEWYHHPGIYFLVYFGGMGSLKILEFILEKLA